METEFFLCSSFGESNALVTDVSNDKYSFSIKKEGLYLIFLTVDHLKHCRQQQDREVSNSKLQETNISLFGGGNR